MDRGYFYFSYIEQQLYGSQCGAKTRHFFAPDLDALQMTRVLNDKAGKWEQKIKQKHYSYAIFFLMLKASNTSNSARASLYLSSLRLFFDDIGVHFM